MSFYNPMCAVLMEDRFAYASTFSLLFLSYHWNTVRYRPSTRVVDDTPSAYSAQPKGPDTACALDLSSLNTNILTQFILDCGSPNLSNDYRLSYSQPGIFEVFRISRDWCFTINNARTKLLKELKVNKSWTCIVTVCPQSERLWCNTE